jgi:N-formylglutamate amidohydrolase
MCRSVHIGDSVLLSLPVLCWNAFGIGSGSGNTKLTLAVTENFLRNRDLLTREAMAAQVQNKTFIKTAASRRLRILPELLWRCRRGAAPLIGTSLHSGHDMRPELLPFLGIDEETRIREEDPFTDYWAAACATHIIARRSRFEVDLNRRIEEAICVEPADCWNLAIWERPIPDSMRERSLAEHTAFYRMLDELLDEWVEPPGRFVIYDFHSYNHRRAGPQAPPADPAATPEINIGTGSMERDYWAPVVDAFMERVAGHDFAGRRLNVCENVNFQGGYFARYVHERYPRQGCVLAIEVKKFFMDEWTGVTDLDQVAELRAAFEATFPAVTASLEQL